MTTTGRQAAIAAVREALIKAGLLNNGDGDAQDIAATVVDAAERAWPRSPPQRSAESVMGGDFGRAEPPRTRHMYQPPPQPPKRFAVAELPPGIGFCGDPNRKGETA